MQYEPEKKLQENSTTDSIMALSHTPTPQAKPKTLNPVYAIVYPKVPVELFRLPEKLDNLLVRPPLVDQRRRLARELNVRTADD